MEKIKVICDTNIFISLFKALPETANTLNKIGNENILMPSLVKMELLQGMTTKKDLQLMVNKLSNYNIIHLNEEVSKNAVELIREYRNSHHLQIPDALIAATCLTFQIPLFTYNLKDFRYIQNLTFYPQ